MIAKRRTYKKRKRKGSNETKHTSKNRKGGSINQELSFSMVPQQKAGKEGLTPEQQKQQEEEQRKQQEEEQRKQQEEEQRKQQEEQQKQQEEEQRKQQEEQQRKQQEEEQQKQQEEEQRKQQEEQQKQQEEEQRKQQEEQQRKQQEEQQRKQQEEQQEEQQRKQQEPTTYKQLDVTNPWNISSNENLTKEQKIQQLQNDFTKNQNNLSAKQKIAYQKNILRLEGQKYSIIKDTSLSDAEKKQFLLDREINLGIREQEAIRKYNDPNTSQQEKNKLFREYKKVGKFKEKNEEEQKKVFEKLTPEEKLNTDFIIDGKRFNYDSELLSQLSFLGEDFGKDFENFLINIIDSDEFKNEEEKNSTIKEHLSGILDELEDDSENKKQLEEFIESLKDKSVFKEKKLIESRQASLQEANKLLKGEEKDEQEKGEQEKDEQEKDEQEKDEQEKDEEREGEKGEGEKGEEKETPEGVDEDEPIEQPSEVKEDTIIDIILEENLFTDKERLELLQEELDNLKNTDETSLSDEEKQIIITNINSINSEIKIVKERQEKITSLKEDIKNAKKNIEKFSNMTQEEIDNLTAEELEEKNAVEESINQLNLELEIAQNQELSSIFDRLSELVQKENLTDKEKEQQEKLENIIVEITGFEIGGSQVFEMIENTLFLDENSNLSLDKKIEIVNKILEHYNIDEDTQIQIKSIITQQETALEDAKRIINNIINDNDEENKDKEISKIDKNLLLIKKLEEHIKELTEVDNKNEKIIIKNFIESLREQNRSIINNRPIVIDLQGKLNVDESLKDTNPILYSLGNGKYTNEYGFEVNPIVYLIESSINNVVNGKVETIEDSNTLELKILPPFTSEFIEMYKSKNNTGDDFKVDDTNIEDVKKQWTLYLNYTSDKTNTITNEDLDAFINQQQINGENLDISSLNDEQKNELRSLFYNDFFKEQENNVWNKILKDYQNFNLDNNISINDNFSSLLTPDLILENKEIQNAFIDNMAKEIDNLKSLFGDLITDIDLKNNDEVKQFLRDNLFKEGSGLKEIIQNSPELFQSLNNGLDKELSRIKSDNSVTVYDNYQEFAEQYPELVTQQFDDNFGYKNIEGNIDYGFNSEYDFTKYSDDYTDKQQEEDKKNLAYATYMVFANSREIEELSDDIQTLNNIENLFDYLLPLLDPYNKNSNYIPFGDIKKLVKFGKGENQAYYSTNVSKNKFKELLVGLNSLLSFGNEGTGKLDEKRLNTLFETISPIIEKLQNSGKLISRGLGGFIPADNDEFNKAEEYRNDIINLIKKEYPTIFEKYEGKNIDDYKKELETLIEGNNKQLETIENIENKQSNSITLQSWENDDYYEPEFENSKIYEENKKLLDYYKNSDNEDLIKKYNELKNSYSNEQKKREQKHLNETARFEIAQITNNFSNISVEKIEELINQNNPIIHSLFSTDIPPEKFQEHLQLVTYVTKHEARLNELNKEMSLLIGEFGITEEISKNIEKLIQMREKEIPIQQDVIRSIIKKTKEGLLNAMKNVPEKERKLGVTTLNLAFPDNTDYSNISKSELANLIKGLTTQVEKIQKDLGVVSNNWDRQKLQESIDELEEDQDFIDARKKLDEFKTKYYPTTKDINNNTMTIEFIKSTIIPKLLQYKSISEKLPIRTLTEEEKQEKMIQAEKDFINKMYFFDTLDPINIDNNLEKPNLDDILSYTPLSDEEADKKWENYPEDKKQEFIDTFKNLRTLEFNQEEARQHMRGMYRKEMYLKLPENVREKYEEDYYTFTNNFGKRNNYDRYLINNINKFKNLMIPDYKSYKGLMIPDFKKGNYTVSELFTFLLLPENIRLPVKFRKFDSLKDVKKIIAKNFLSDFENQKTSEFNILNNGNVDMIQTSEEVELMKNLINGIVDGKMNKDDVIDYLVRNKSKQAIFNGFKNPYINDPEDKYRKRDNSEFDTTQRELNLLQLLMTPEERIYYDSSIGIELQKIKNSSNVTIDGKLIDDIFKVEVDDNGNEKYSIVIDDETGELKEIETTLNNLLFETDENKYENNKVLIENRIKELQGAIGKINETKEEGKELNEQQLYLLKQYNQELNSLKRNAYDVDIILDAYDNPSSLYTKSYETTRKLLENLMTDTNISDEFKDKYKPIFSMLETYNKAFSDTPLKKFMISRFNDFMDSLDSNDFLRDVYIPIKDDYESKLQLQDLNLYGDFTDEQRKLFIQILDPINIDNNLDQLYSDLSKEVGPEKAEEMLTNLSGINSVIQDFGSFTEEIENNGKSLFNNIHKLFTQLTLPRNKAKALQSRIDELQSNDFVNNDTVSQYFIDALTSNYDNYQRPKEF